MTTKTALSLAAFCSVLVGFGFIAGVFTALYALVYSDVQIRAAGKRVSNIIRDNGGRDA